MYLATSDLTSDPRDLLMAGGEAFAPLLNYMYTGRLEVTLDNVYSVLLATHLLHMPGALEQCRAALLRLRAPPALPTPMPVPTAATSPPGTGSILRPIPSRLLVGPPLCWPPTTPLYPPTAPAPASVAMSHLPQIPPSVLMQPTVPPSISVVAPGTRNKQEQCAHYRFAERERERESAYVCVCVLKVSHRKSMFQVIILLILRILHDYFNYCFDWYYCCRISN